MEAEKSNVAKDFLKQVRLCDIHIKNKLEEGTAASSGLKDYIILVFRSCFRFRGTG